MPDDLQPLQVSLIDYEDDAAVLFSRETLQKQYTAGQVQELERLREAVFMLLPAWPIEDIARRLKMNTRTVRALAALYSEKVAGSKIDFTRVLRSTAARWLALARTREHEATFKDLAVGLGIILDKARDIEITGEVGEEKILKDASQRVAASEELRRLMEESTRPEDPAGPGTGTTDRVSGEEPCNDKGLKSAKPGCDAVVSGDKDKDAPPTKPEQAGQDGGGGGSEGSAL